MTNYKEIIRLHSLGLNKTRIAESCGCARSTVITALHKAEENGLSWNAVKNLSSEEVTRKLYPATSMGQRYSMPDYEWVHKEMQKSGVTLSLLWVEYCERCRQNGELPYKSTQFNKYYADYVHKTKATMHLEHKPSENLQVDWAGQTAGITDTDTGERLPAYLFVAVLPYSGYAYTEAFLNMKQEAWITAHVHAYNYFGGVTRILTPDNLKTGVLKHPREGEIVLNEAYEALGEHYMTAIMPAQVRKPKQKASAEGTVKDAATWVIAQLRNEVFTSFDQVQLAVRKCLSDYNAHPFQKREGSRDSVFSEVEAAQLRPLPDVRYDVAEWVYGRSVNLDFHVVYAKNRYSVPCRYAGRKVDLRVGESTIGIYHAGERIATHRLLPPYVKNGYSTDPAHMPDSFAKPEWDDVRIKGWASDVGPSCRAVDRIFDGVKLKEQAYNPSLSVLRLSRRYGKDRLEAACDHALPKIRSPRYRHIKAILDANLERGESPEPKRPGGGRPRGHLRGADYYRD